jgi:accessory gene regulator B
VNTPDAFFKKIQISYALSDRDIRYLKFSLTALAYDISKILLMFIFFYCIHETWAFILVALLFALLRRNHGGIHLKHYASCFFASFFIFLLSICIMPSLFVCNKTIMLCLLILCMISNYFIGPLRSEQCHVENQDIFKKNQIFSFMVIFIYSILLYFLPLSHLLTCGFWVILSYSCQLIIAKCSYIIKGRRKYHEK